MPDVQERLILVGNPNVGKSVVFSSLTGMYMAVSNYPGTTVETFHGRYVEDRELAVLDTPGINSLVPASEDERVTRSILLEEGDKVVIQVADAKNLRRALLLTSQLAEMGFRLLLVLNMSDEAQQKGIDVDTPRLSRALGIPVVKTVATRNLGITQLKKNIRQAATSALRISYDPDVEAAIARIQEQLPPLPIAGRGASVMLLAGDRTFREWLSSRVSPEGLGAIERIVPELQSGRADPLGYSLSQQRGKAIGAILDEVVSVRTTGGKSVMNVLGGLSTHPVAGIPILLGILFILYEFVGVLGAGIAVDFIEGVVFGDYINPWASRLFELVPWTFFQDMVVGEYGLITMGLTYAVAIVLPIMFFFFLAFSTLEDIGYLPRLSLMANKVFRVIGLSGKAVLPMLLGLGCDTMATLTTRILETRRERLIVTILLALGIPCSAQLGVILAMMASVSPVALVLFVAIISSQLLLVGFLAARILPGKPSDFIAEIPPFRMPRLSNVVLKTAYRVEWFLKEAVPLFLLGTFILFIAHETGFLGILERWASPLVTSFLGLPKEATQSFLMGFLRRDYGAAGFFVLQEEGMLNTVQVLVSLVTITLFVPCIANLFVIVKERGFKTALAIVAFIFPFAILVGGVLNLTLRVLAVSL